MALAFSRSERATSFALPEPPSGEALDPERVLITYEESGTSTQIPRVFGNECGGLTAFRYDDANAPTEIALCPAACAALGGQGKIRIALGCAPVVAR